MVNHVEERVTADMARLKRAETHCELAGAESYVDGNETEFVQRLDQQVVARRGQRHDDGVDSMDARVADQLVDRTKKGMPHAALRQAGPGVAAEPQGRVRPQCPGR